MVWRLHTRLLRKRSRVRLRYSSRIFVHEYECLYWIWVFSMYVFIKKYIHTYTYHSRFIPKGVAEAQIFIGSANVFPKLFSYEYYVCLLQK
jgi:hypothetical protein